MKKNILRWLEEARKRYCLDAWNIKPLFDIKNEEEVMMTASYQPEYLQAVIGDKC